MRANHAAIATRERRRREALRWMQSALLVAGAILLGFWIKGVLEAHLYQRAEAQRLHEILRTAQPRPESGSPPPEPLLQEASLRRASATRAVADSAGIVGRLEIPRLDISVVVAEGIDGKTLRRAVGHIPGTPFPGEPGNVGLAGHRDSFFRPLKDAVVQDSIRIVTPDGTFHYIVESYAIVSPDSTAVLDSSGSDRVLTLVTCYPFHYVGRAPARFVLQARQVEPARES